MSTLMQEMSAKALQQQVPLSVQLDLTYRCNERCVHCYLDHEDYGEMTTVEIKKLLDELAEANVFFLTMSGGEILMRKDFFEILEYARALLFCVTLKTNAVLIRERQAERIRTRSALGPDQHLFASPGNSRLHYQGSGFAEAISGRDSSAKSLRLESDDC